MIENSKKTAKKFKKLKNIIVTSFEAKIGLKRLGKRENKNYRSVPFRSHPMCNRKFQKKIAKKFKKLKKYHNCLISSQNRLEEAEKERKEKLLFRFVPAQCVIENSKKLAKKIQKIKKYHYEFISSQNRLEKDEKERYKNYRSIPFRTNPICNKKFQTNS